MPTDLPTDPPADVPAARGRLAAARDAAGAGVGVVLGIVPHVLHHIGLLAGAALVTGATGNLVFLAVGLVFTTPLLRRLYRRFRTWWAPAIAVAVFAGLFSVSAFVVGPAISGDPTPDNEPPAPSQTPSPDDLDEHGRHGH